MIRCPSCKNAYTGPFVCVTCGAQKLYDATLRTAERRAEKAERELAAAQKDAERYRWLREEWSNRKWRHVPIGHGDELDGDDITFPDTIDAAIDAAMEKAK